MNRPRPVRFALHPGQILELLYNIPQVKCNRFQARRWQRCLTVETRYGTNVGAQATISVRLRQGSPEQATKLVRYTNPVSLYILNP